MSGTGVRREAEIRRLFKARPRSSFVRWSCGIFAALVVLSWIAGDFSLGDLLSERRLANSQRFLQELRPYPLQGAPFDLGVAVTWVQGKMAEHGWEAARRTLAISIVAITLAGALALLLSLLAARNVACSHPFLPSRSGEPGRWNGAWRGLALGMRGTFILLRSIPEYVWAFLLLALLGPVAWPAILALMLHNGGILGKLTAEVVENVEPGPVAALRQGGASRGQVAVVGLYPIILNRFLLFFFYRWESCVREATVLGMLGMASLGFWIIDARARNHYDDMILYVLVGAGLVFAGDLVSAFAREVVRRAR